VLANTFDIGAFTGHVVVTGGQASDTLDMSNSPSAVFVDLDQTDYNQTVNSSGLTLDLQDAIENFTGSVYNDQIFVDALPVTRTIDGGAHTQNPPGDFLTVDGQNRFVTVARPTFADPDSGTVTAFGFSPVSFTRTESLDVTNSRGITGMGGLDIEAYTSEVSYAGLGKKPRATALGDLNGDGWTDIVAINNSGRASVASVFLGNGDGSFGAATAFAAGGRGSFDVELADMTGDGNLDAVITNHRSNTVSLLAGNGAGAFGPAATFATGTKLTGKGPMSLALADVDGDTDIDVVTANNKAKIKVAGIRQGAVSVMLNNGTGTLGAATTYASGGRKPKDVELVDVDGDTDLDILVGNRRAQNVGVLLNNGAGAFGAATGFGNTSAETSLVATDNNGNYLDFNLDGNPDLAVGNVSNNYVSVFLGDGAGTFSLASQANYLNKTAQAIAAGDVNSDGKVDLVLAHNSGNLITVLLGNGNGTFSDPYEFDIGTLLHRSPESLTLGDLNNDGGIDMVIANTDSNDVSVLLKNLAVV